MDVSSKRKCFRLRTASDFSEKLSFGAKLAGQQTDEAYKRGSVRWHPLLPCLKLGDF
jgi:hypothetical protein